MSEPTISTHCVICGQPETSSTNPLCVDDFDETIAVHLNCLDGPEWQQWEAEQKQRNPLYRRYIELMTYGRPITCPACGASQRLGPKAVGIGAGVWEINCTSCHREGEPLRSDRRRQTGWVYQELEKTEG